MTALSVLDLVMIGEGKTFADAINESRQLAKHVENHGYSRYWIAEHHDMPGIGSAATSLIISDLASATKSIRVGAGGIMLPNHSPLVVAEHFGTLDTLYPGRIDLGLGRAPGTGGPTIQALRRDAPERDFAQDVLELMDYLADNGRRPVRGAPGEHDVPLWILGSSLYGAELAASLGLPYAFASHFAPRFLDEALAHYRKNFRPSRFLSKPYVMVGANIFAADTKGEADFLASSHRKWMTDLHVGRVGLLPKPQEGYVENLPAREAAVLQQVMACTVAGDKAEVSSWVRKLVERTGADELMIDCRIYDPQARMKSHQYVAQAMGDLLTRP
ncbi:LLM class flavin-dependent oxidoreductase [Pseudomonas syringae pv. dysoxyli]|uniref:LLM class flavin-dependent oxidoreductase n=1 Tax=Pseudomonas syringae TaxID=317 RepID=UPI0013731B4D|nr:LLM class flavin-dependent oxidoreductase [Pseudomonas syringae]NAO28853.1 LLM class flavin-dependent oxidoreductase [Pseudomonas syringae pv. dysoxyli]